MRFAKGREYRIRFLDHAEDSSDPIPFVLTGRVVALQRHSVTIAPWFYGDDRDFDMKDDNVKKFSIVRSTITESQAL